MLQVTNGVVQGSNIGGVPFSARIVKPSGAKNVRTLAPMPVVLGTTTHNTANVQKGADAELHAAYLQNIENADIEYKSWHFTVDDDSIVQHLPLTEHGFHAGDGSGPGNLQTIAVEVAENGDYAKAEYNAIILMAHLNIWLKANGKGYKSFKHQDWSGKWCPRRILGDPKRPETNRWSEYVSRVNAEIARVTNLKQPGVLYRVQTGAFKTYNLAKELETKLKAKGYDTYLVYFDGWYKVQIGAYAERANADVMGAALKRDGFDVYITTRSGVKAVAPSVPKPAPTIKVGSKVRVRQGARDYDRGLQLHSEVYRTTYDVIQIRGDRIVIGLGSSVTTAVHKDNLFLA